MGKQVGYISGAIGGEKIEVAPTGIVFKPTAENLKKWKDWLTLPVSTSGSFLVSAAG